MGSMSQDASPFCTRTHFDSYVLSTSVVTSKPAMRGRLKTGHGEWPKTGFVLPCRSWFGKAGFDFSYVLS